MALWACMVASTLKIGVGDFSVGLHVVLFTVAWVALPRRSGQAQVRVGRIIGIWASLLVGHFLLALFTTPCTDLLLKSGVSLVLILLLLGAVGHLATATPPVQSLTTDMKAVVAMVAGALILEVALGRAPGGEGIVRAGGIFPEPSHLALAISPVLVGLMLAEKFSDQLWGWGGFMLMMALSASATLFIMVTLCFVTALLAKSRTNLSVSMVARVVLLLTFMVGLVVYTPYRDEFASRVAGLTQIDASANVSSLVYVNGWEMTLQNLQTTQGLGLGFNRMGCNPRPESDAGALLEVLGVGDLNYNDGSFIMSKLLSELGLLGLAFWAFAMLVLARIVFMKSRRPLGRLPADVHAMLVSGVTVITLGALIRATNYFSGPFVFGLFCVIFVCAHGQGGARSQTRRRAVRKRPAADIQPVGGPNA